MRARYLSALVLLACIVGLPQPSSAGNMRLEGYTVSASGVHAMLYVAPIETNWGHDVLIRFDRPIFPRFVELSLGRLVSHDDGRESYLEVSTSLPYSFARDASDATCALYIASGHRLYTPAHQVAIKVAFARQGAQGEAAIGATDSVAFTFSDLSDGSEPLALDSNSVKASF